MSLVNAVCSVKKMLIKELKDFVLDKSYYRRIGSLK